MEQELDRLMKEFNKPEKKGFFKKRVLGIPVFLLAILGISLIGAVAIWVLTQTTTITLAPYETPTISEDIVLTGMSVGTYQEKEITVTNTNDVPLHVTSYPSGFKVYVDGDLIGEGYTVDQLQQFAYVSNIKVSDADRYGCDDASCSNLVIPEKSTTTYTIAYHIPITYLKDGETKTMSGSEVIQVKWQPKVSLYTGDFYNGYEDWDNTFVPSWYIP